MIIMTGYHEWFKSKGYKLKKNISLGGKIPDLIAYKNSGLIAIEEKKYAKEIPDAIGQCLHYLQQANKVFIVIPHKQIEKISDSTLKVLKINGIGLIGNSEKINIVIEARSFDKPIEHLVRKFEERKESISKIDKTDILRKNIIKLLKLNPEGLTIVEISKKIGINRNTVAKYIYELSGAGIIQHRKIGTAKLCFLAETKKKRKEWMAFT